jgi:SAM-dependent methyltransferase
MLRAMTTPLTYDFGYSWSVVWGHTIPIVLFGGLAAVGVYLRWRPWIVGGSIVVALWGMAGLFVLHVLAGINVPLEIPSGQFLASGAGRVLDVGAGSGRATVGVLQTRPRTTVTALDIYSGYFGIDDNTAERLMLNARIAGVADRVDVKVGDARSMPLADDSYDGVISTYAIDHLNAAGIPMAISEVARVLKPNGEFLLEIVNVDWWVRLAAPFPHGLGHHRAQDPARWRTLLETSGLHVVEQGTRPATLYFLSRKSRS